LVAVRHEGGFTIPSSLLCTTQYAVHLHCCRCPMRHASTLPVSLSTFVNDIFVQAENKLPSRLHTASRGKHGWYSCQPRLPPVDALPQRAGTSAFAYLPADHERAVARLVACGPARASPALSASHSLARLVCLPATFRTLPPRTAARGFDTCPHAHTAHTARQAEQRAQFAIWTSWHGSCMGQKAHGACLCHLPPTPPLPPPTYLCLYTPLPSLPPTHHLHLQATMVWILSCHAYTRTLTAPTCPATPAHTPSLPAFTYHLGRHGRQVSRISSPSTSV